MTLQPSMLVLPMPAVLVIAGVDSSGGAGLLRDIRTLTELGVDSLCAVTAVTAQTNSNVSTVHHVPPSVIGAQIAAALATRPIAAVKIGMLGTSATVGAVAKALSPHAGTVPIILDPVLVATSGGVLLDAGGRDAMREQLFPMATLVTPNLPEAAMLLGRAPATPARCNPAMPTTCEPAPTVKVNPLSDEADVIDQARQLLMYGASAILIKGGHADEQHAIDYLVTRSGFVHRFSLRRVRSTHRGTGCALASAIAARMALGDTLERACHQAKGYVHASISRAGGMEASVAADSPDINRR
jgi:hydroxymethylpyrimidine/phosphomethylpyrimidine kinase